ncbi:hypothetical protein HYU18_04995 [Candidatus Woesearchaeota archaeon]|nr:hypothetical protein [Candidatus Woesearchaeota archaeon]
MIHLSKSLSYYKREDVQRALVEHGKDKEVAARYNDRFGKRPDTLTYPGDVLELAKKGATSFHCSEELWTNPLLLAPQMPKAELDRLRKGWDLLLDIDTDAVDKEAGFEYSKMAANLIVKELRLQGIKSVTAKFSGNKGFHIAVPYETFPKEVNGKEIRDEFPNAAKRVAIYLKEKIKKNLGEEILGLENNSFAKVAARTGKKISDLHQKSESANVTATEKPILNAEPFLVIDTILISSRHMYRMPYSLHEKSGLASVPVDPDGILGFSKDQAAAEKVKVGEHSFLDRENATENEAEKLFIAAYDFGKTQMVEVKKENREFSGEIEEIEGKIPEQYFPPCIRKMLEGVADGRKRALFVLANFLRCCNYGDAEVEAIIKEWNDKNSKPLPPLQIATHLSYTKHKQEKILPPNCSNVAYYKEIGIECTPECGTCKNPVAEAKQIYRRAMRIAASAPKQKETKPHKPQ